MEVSKMYSFLVRALIFASLLCNINKVFGQIVIEEEPKMLYYDITAKRITNFWEMKNFRDVFHKNKWLMGMNRITGNISYNTGRVLINDGVNIHNEYRSALGFYTRIRFFEEFSFNSTFYADFNRKADARWISDYSYSVGRYNWRPNKFNYGYENYVNNKYTDNFKTFARKFTEGYYFISYNRSLSQKLTEKISLDQTTSVKFIGFARYAIKYRDENEVEHGGLFNGKATLGLSARYTIIKNIYIESAVYYYPDPKKTKQPWDPDYSYGFGYFDWRSFRISLTYGNWVINRFPWNKNHDYPQYGFIDGNFRIVANYIW
ncbi:MAG: hypothetical protein ACXVPU_01515 [Bacteroidia bacterium]